MAHPLCSRRQWSVDHDGEGSPRRQNPGQRHLTTSQQDGHQDKHVHHHRHHEHQRHNHVADPQRRPLNIRLLSEAISSLVLLPVYKFVVCLNFQCPRFLELLYFCLVSTSVCYEMRRAERECSLFATSGTMQAQSWTLKVGPLDERNKRRGV